MEKDQIEFDIKLAKIAMVFGASVAVGITIAGVGIALIAEHTNVTDIAYFKLGFFLELFAIAIIICVTIIARKEIDNLKKKYLKETKDETKQEISYKNCFIYLLLCKLYDGIKR